MPCLHRSFSAKEPYNEWLFSSKEPYNEWLFSLTSHISLINILCKVITRWYRVAKTHRMPYLHRSFSAKEPYSEWLFAEIMSVSVAKNDLQLKPSYKSSPPCNIL